MILPPHRGSAALPGRKPGSGPGLCDAARPACSRRYQLRESLSEGETAAGKIMAVEAPDAQKQRHVLADARQIGWTAFKAAVNGRAGRATGCATPMRTPRMGKDDKTTVALHDALDGAARQGRGQDHSSDESARAIPVTATVPRKVRQNCDAEGGSLPIRHRGRTFEGFHSVPPERCQHRPETLPD